MAKLSSKAQSKTHRCIIYGAPKTGKTLLAGKLAEHYDVILVDMEKGKEVLFQLPVAWQERIELINLPDTRNYPVGIETCLKMVKGPVSICEIHGKVGCMICKKEQMTAKKANPDILDTEYFIATDLPALGPESVVIFDSLTQLTNSAIAHITRKQPEDYSCEWDDWGNLGKLLDIFLSHIQQANYNVIVISHESEVETATKKKVIVPVGGTRNFSRNVAKYFDHVIYAELKNKKHRFFSSTTDSTNITAGSRTGISLEGADGEASLLRIFKPELYPDVPAIASIGSIGSNGATKRTSADVLAKLRAGGIAKK